MADEIRRRKSKKIKDNIQPDNSRSLSRESFSKKTTVSKPKFGKFNIRTASADSIMSGNIPFYSPQLSTDYFELPRSNQERREWYRHFYENDEIVGKAIDLHTDLPLSKVVLAKPKCSNKEKADFIWRFFDRMLNRVNFFQRLEELAHEYWLFGNVFIFAEEDTNGLEDLYPNPEVIEKYTEDEDDNYSDFLENKIDNELQEEFEKINDEIEDFINDEIEEEQLTPEQQKEKEKIRLKYKEWGFKNIDYKGWKRLIILPPDQVVLESYDFTDKVNISLSPSESMRKLLENHDSDNKALDILHQMPHEIIDRLRSGELLPLDTDPYSGSHCYHMSTRKSQYEDFGQSLLQRCLRTLLLRDKLRQIQSQIADRAMTPKHIVWAEGLSDFQVDELREHVDLAMVDPDYAIVTNYQVTWDKVSNADRLLDLSSEYQEAENRLLVGLGVTKEILTGEGTYGGNRITLEIMNTQYLLFREKIQHWVEEYLFKPIALKKGFYEIDPIDGEINPIIPKLRFTRLAVRDNADTYEQLFALYQKGSLPIEYILDLFNIDSIDAREKLEKDLFTVNDSRFNDLLGAIYQNSGDKIIGSSNVVDLLRDSLNLEEVEVQSEDEGGLGRFGSSIKNASSNPKIKETLDSNREELFNEYKEFLEFLKMKKEFKNKEN